MVFWIFDLKMCPLTNMSRPIPTISAHYDEVFFLLKIKLQELERLNATVTVLKNHNSLMGYWNWKKKAETENIYDRWS